MPGKRPQNQKKKHQHNQPEHSEKLVNQLMEQRKVQQGALMKIMNSINQNTQANKLKVASTIKTRPNS